MLCHLGGGSGVRRGHYKHQICRDSGEKTEQASVWCHVSLTLPDLLVFPPQSVIHYGLVVVKYCYVM